MTGELGATPWAAGEVVRLLVDIGTGLERLHGAGRAHGGLDRAGSWEVDPSGGVALGPGDGSGSPARDVDALARTALRLLGRLPGECRALPVGTHDPGAAPAHDDGPAPWYAAHVDDDDATAGLVPRVPGCPDDDVPRERLRHVLLQVTARPGATPVGLLVTRALAVADTVPVHRPDPGVLARDALVRGAGMPDPAAGRARHRRAGRARGPFAPVAAGAAVLGLGLTALLAVGEGAAVLGGPSAAGVDATTSAAGAPGVLTVVGSDERLEGDVVVLTRTRAAALAGGDLLRLLRVTVPGSPAALADLHQYARLHAGAPGAAPGPASGSVPPGEPSTGSGGSGAGGSVGVRVERVSVLPPDEDGARVLLVAAVGPGGQLEATPARGVVLSVTDGAGTWQVREVTATSPTAP